MESSPICGHLDQVKVTELDEVAGCEQCLEAGAAWVHLRQCLTCGKVGCCDNSPHRHATAHFQETGHPLIRSAEPDEDWSWCYLDEAFFVMRFEVG
jgi:CPA2 family monovalent cation:H+ antiporter-2